jgi:hypothetical protein
MFNSPLQYCVKCKHYVELDQTVEECAKSHGCEGQECPLSHVFRPPTTEEQPATQPVPDTVPGPKRTP